MIHIPLVAVYYGGKLLAKAIADRQARTSSAPPILCSGCRTIPSTYRRTTCCQAPLCESCQGEWLRAGGKTCVFCHTRHD